jgi:nitrous oxide reductase accessory protein NosL
MMQSRQDAAPTKRIKALGNIRMNLNHRAAVILLMLFFASPLGAGEKAPAGPGPKDKCPVCGMFVYKYPDWVGQIAFKDGSAVFFDGAKDLFKYYFNLKKYSPARTTGDIAAIWVTEYYELVPLDAKTAFFVVGSDVFGPMGRELIPFRTLDAAREFKKDHGGTDILTFGQVSLSVLTKLD